MTIPRQLISYLNSGKCFAMIGSGPSTEMRYPSWKGLAEQAITLASGAKISKGDAEALQMLLRSDDYPEVFQRAATHTKGVDQLIGGLRRTLKPANTTGRAYELLARWPFRCYLTTNYEIVNTFQRKRDRHVQFRLH